MAVPNAFYVPAGDGFQATELTRGPWDPGLQHAGPPSALLARAIARASGIPDGQTARITVDILGPLPIGLLHVETEVLRPGRRVEQIEARLLHAGRLLMRASAWRLRTTAGTERPDAPGARFPGRSAQEASAIALPFWGDEIAYHRAFEWRLAAGSVDEPGPAFVWTQMTALLVQGEPAQPLERLLCMADAASGVSWVLPWEDFTFPNVDFGVHLERPPVGQWLGMDAVTRPGERGAGQCTSVLYDGRGRIGTTTQTLLIDAR